MASDGGTGGRCFGDLPDDLLGAIYRRCSSPYDRGRFAAVCTSWRAAASWQPRLPALPLLLNSTGNGSLDRKARAYSPEDGRVLPAALPWHPYGKRIVGCHAGGWVAAAIGRRIDVVNLFTRAWVVMSREIACRCRIRQTGLKIYVEKIVFSEDPASEGCILAAMTSWFPNYYLTRHITLYRLGGLRGEWTAQGCCTDPTPFRDIAFCNGELYGLESSKLVYKLVIGLNTPVVISLEELTIKGPTMFNPWYIFELHGKLALTVEVGPVSTSGSKARILRVFQLASSDDTTQAYKYTWEEVTSLDDHALFLGPGCCKAVRVTETRMRGEVQGNRIYYTKEHRHLNENVSKCLGRLDLGSCHVYCYESEGVHHPETIMSRGYYYREEEDGVNGRNSCTWILPPHF